jgi:hypothetical protein
MSKEQTYKDYPKAASKNAQKAIDWKEKYGRDTVSYTHLRAHETG